MQTGQVWGNSESRSIRAYDQQVSYCLEASHWFQALPQFDWVVVCPWGWAQNHLVPGDPETRTGFDVEHVDFHVRVL